MDENNNLQNSQDWNPVPPPDPTMNGAQPPVDQPANQPPVPPVPPQTPPVPPAQPPVNGGFQGGPTPPVYPPQPMGGQPGFNGQPGYVPYNAVPPQPLKQPGDSTAVAALVLGIIGLFCCGGVFSILAIVFGFMARSKGTAKEGMALAGIIMGFIGLVGGILIYVIAAATGALAELMSNSSYYYY